MKSIHAAFAYGLVTQLGGAIIFAGGLAANNEGPGLIVGVLTLLVGFIICAACLILWDKKVSG